MSHHGDDEAMKMLRATADRLAGDVEPGATGRYPHGKLTNDDEGEIALRIARKGDVVLIEFGKATKWIGFTAKEARDLADLLIKHANEASR